jgi:cytochrome bd-type quinol oxidase subunit 1
MKYVIFALMSMVLYSLGSASYYMLKGRDSEKMAKALTWRIVLSLAIFILLFVAFAAGWLRPHEILMGR